MNAVWRPVQAGEAPRRVILGSQITVIAGAACSPSRNPLFSVKLQKNGSIDIAAGQGQADTNKPGMANAQITTTEWAMPGDFFNVIFMATAWQPGDSPISFPNPWARGSIPGLGNDYVALDNNQFHTSFWGTDVMPEAAATRTDE